MQAKASRRLGGGLTTTSYVGRSCCDDVGVAKPLHGVFSLIILSHARHRDAGSHLNHDTDVYLTNFRITFFHCRGHFSSSRILLVSSRHFIGYLTHPSRVWNFLFSRWCKLTSPTRQRINSSFLKKILRKSEIFSPPNEIITSNAERFGRGSPSAAGTARGDKSTRKLPQSLTR